MRAIQADRSCIRRLGFAQFDGSEHCTIIRCTTDFRFQTKQGEQKQNRSKEERPTGGVIVQKNRGKVKPLVFTFTSISLIVTFSGQVIKTNGPHQTKTHPQPHIPPLNSPPIYSPSPSSDCLPLPAALFSIFPANFRKYGVLAILGFRA